MELNNRVGKYKLLTKIWDGNFSETWEGKNETQESVAIQIVRDLRIIDNLEKHALDLPDFSHPSLPNLLSIEPTPFSFVWEYVQGRRLSTYIQNLKQIKKNIALYIVRKLLETLRFIASQGKVHGGIRPSRILVTPDKRVILCNFGIGYLEQWVLSEIFARKEEMPKYKNLLPYFPMEVLEDHLFDDPKSDIFSVGMVLSEMITGQCVASDKIPMLLRVKNIPADLTHIVLKATADFEERYNHPQEMYEDITGLLKHSDQVEKIFVPPPKGSLNIAMEAIPADSEEYRIYQADVASARQTIDAEVVAAEPVELPEDALLAPRESSISLKRREGKKDTLKKTVRIPAPPLLVLATIDKKILDPLEKDALWPYVLGKYALACAGLLALIFILAAILGASPSQDMAWILFPFYAMSHWLGPLEFLGNVIVQGGLLLLFFLPLCDPQAHFMRSKVLISLLTLYLVILFGLGVWGALL